MINCVFTSVYNIRTRNPHDKKAELKAEMNRTERRYVDTVQQTRNNLFASKLDATHELKNDGFVSVNSIENGQKRSEYVMNKTRANEEAIEQKNLRRLKELFDTCEQEIGDFVSKNFGYDAQISIDDFKKWANQLGY